MTYLIEGHYEIPQDRLITMRLYKAALKKGKLELKANHTLLPNHKSNLTDIGLEGRHQDQAEAGLPCQATTLYLANSNITPHCVII